MGFGRELSVPATTSGPSGRCSVSGAREPPEPALARRGHVSLPGGTMVVALGPRRWARWQPGSGRRPLRSDGCPGPRVESASPRNAHRRWRHGQKPDSAVRPRQLSRRVRCGVDRAAAPIVASPGRGSSLIQRSRRHREPELGEFSVVHQAGPHETDEPRLRNCYARDKRQPKRSRGMRGAPICRRDIRDRRVRSIAPRTDRACRGFTARAVKPADEWRAPIRQCGRDLRPAGRTNGESCRTAIAP